MKRYLAILLFFANGCYGASYSKGLFTFGALAPLDQWEKPDPRLRLDQVTYLGAHNAYANVQEGFVYAQQFWSLENQLKRGVRHFLLDIWPSRGRLLLCHNRCIISSALKLGRRNRDLRSALVLVKSWLDEHLDEILTLELENYATGNQTYEIIKSVPGLEGYILKRADYEPQAYRGRWPTIQYLVDNNKRLIIFDTQDNHHYAFDSYVYLLRNAYGALDIEKAACLRPPAVPSQSLYQLNYFGTITSPSPCYNEPDRLQQLLKRCQEKGVVPEGKCPNFIALDFVDRGNAMRWVNELNRQAARGLDASFG